MRDPTRPSIPAQRLCTHTGCRQIAVTSARRAPLCAWHAVQTIIVPDPKVFKGQRGQGLLEYGAIILLVALVVVGGIVAIAPMLNSIFSSVVPAL